jgi:hypothetical protein
MHCATRSRPRCLRCSLGSHTARRWQWDYICRTHVAWRGWCPQNHRQYSCDGRLHCRDHACEHKPNKTPIHMHTLSRHPSTSQQNREMVCVLGQGPAFHRRRHHPQEGKAMAVRWVAQLTTISWGCHGKSRRQHRAQAIVNRCWSHNVHAWSCSARILRRCDVRCQ